MCVNMRRHRGRDRASERRGERVLVRARAHEVDRHRGGESGRPGGDAQPMLKTSTLLRKHEKLIPWAPA